jgi:hypothetical protein
MILLHPTIRDDIKGKEDELNELNVIYENLNEQNVLLVLILIALLNFIAFFKHSIYFVFYIILSLKFEYS